jgi:hypothetical protein
MLYHAQQGELKKLDKYMDNYHQHFPNEKLATDTVTTIMEAYTNVQQKLLQRLDQSSTRNDSFSEISSNDCFQALDHLDSSDDASNTFSDNVQSILNQAWDVTNDLDDFIGKVRLSDNRANNNGGHSSMDQRHYIMILQAWDGLRKAYEKANGWNVSTPKGIPQRATLHLECMEQQMVSLQRRNSSGSSSGDEVAMVHDDSLTPTIEMYNIVLDMWSKSQEHFLSQRAESIVRKMELLMLQPNVETYRIMIRAWCRTVDDVVASKNKIGTAAFNATGYLIRMQNMMERGHLEFEPSMEDYTMVFRAWAKAG